MPTIQKNHKLSTKQQLPLTDIVTHECTCGHYGNTAPAVSSNVKSQVIPTSLICLLYFLSSPLSMHPDSERISREFLYFTQYRVVFEVCRVENELRDRTVQSWGCQRKAEAKITCSTTAVSEFALPHVTQACAARSGVSNCVRKLPKLQKYHTNKPTPHCIPCNFGI